MGGEPGRASYVFTSPRLKLREADGAFIWAYHVTRRKGTRRVRDTIEFTATYTITPNQSNDRVGCTVERLIENLVVVDRGLRRVPACVIKEVLKSALEEENSKIRALMISSGEA